MYMRNNSGPNTVPWGTPDRTGAGSDDSPSHTTHIVRPVRNALFWQTIVLANDCLPNDLHSAKDPLQTEKEAFAAVSSGKFLQQFSDNDFSY